MKDIPFIQLFEGNPTIHFCHGNGFVPESYTSLLKAIHQQTGYGIKCFLLRPLWEKHQMAYNQLNDWEVFYNDLKSYLKKNLLDNDILIGHSIGGNLALRMAVENEFNLKHTILLDPTFFIKSHIYVWKMFSFLNLQHLLLPLIKKTKNKKMIYSSKLELYNRYRSKKIFKRLSDEHLINLIDSISIVNKNGDVIIFYDNLWEMQIYKAASKKDLFIWNHLQSLSQPIHTLYASESDVFLEKTKQNIQKNTSFFTFNEIDGTHLFPIENPIETANVILKEMKLTS